METRSSRNTKGKNTKRNIGIAVAAILVLGGAAAALVLNQPKKEAKPTTESTTRSTKEKVPPKKLFNPLTGEQQGDTDNPKPVGHAAVGVKQENAYSEGIPQSKLNDADVVYEYPLESHWDTRFLPIYYTKVPDNVGPIRSFRVVDTSIMSPLKYGMLSYSGAYGNYPDELAKYGIIMNEAGDSWRESRYGAVAPHNLYMDPKKAMSKMPKDIRTKDPVAQFNYQDTTPTIASTGETLKSGVSFDMATTQKGISWTWANNRFNYNLGGEPLTLQDGKQIWADKVILIHATFEELPYKDPAGTPGSNVVITGDRDGYLLDNNKIVKIKTKKEKKDSVMKYYTTDGKEIVMEKGRTFVECITDPEWKTIQYSTDKKEQ